MVARVPTLTVSFLLTTTTVCTYIIRPYCTAVINAAMQHPLRSVQTPAEAYSITFFVIERERDIRHSIHPYMHMKNFYPTSLQPILQRFLQSPNSNGVILGELLQLNDEIESYFSNGHDNEAVIQRQEPNQIEILTAQFVKGLSCQLYSILIGSLSKLEVFHDSLATTTDLQLDTPTREEEEEEKEERHYADVALSISKSLEKKSYLIKNAAHHQDGGQSFDFWTEKSIKEVKLFSLWIRTCKNLIRWNRMHYMKIRLNNNRNAQSTGGSGTEQQLHQWSVATERLCSVGMVSLYLQILNFFIYKTVSNDIMGGTLTLDDVARQCSTILFYATYGQAPEPCCQKALREFVSSLNGIRVIAKILVTPTKECECSVATMLWLIKLVHNLVSSVNHALFDFEKAFREVEGDIQGVQCYQVNLYSILVATLGWSLSAEPSFVLCGPDDKRPDLVVEIIRVLFAKQTVGTKASSSWKKQYENENDELTKHLRMMVVFILQLPNKNQRFYECKLASLLLLMNDASNYVDLLVEHHNVVDQLLTILWLQLNTLLIEHAGEVHSERNATIVLPILIVLNHLVSCNHDIWGKVKEYIFPSCDENVFLQKAEMHQKEVSESQPEEETQRNGGRKNMHPIDAPVGTIRWKLIKLMTFSESNVKRCASELLWKICREDPGEFVLRCGFGNAVHMLGIKGLYTIPKS